jgi:hypothetical protein
MVDVSQDRIVSFHKLRHHPGARHILKRNRPQLDLARTKLIVSSLQLDELLAARASGLPAIKDEHHAFSARLTQAKHLAVLALKAEIRRGMSHRCSHFGGHQSGRRQR